MTEQEQVPLLPCPFCGGKAFLDCMSRNEQEECVEMSVECLPCEATIMRGGMTTAEAIAAWNTRHTATAEALEALREFSSEYDGFLNGDGEPCPTLMKARAAIAKIEGEQP
jgi:Lar family restriction alleviation protein